MNTRASMQVKAKGSRASALQHAGNRHSHQGTSRPVTPPYSNQAMQRFLQRGVLQTKLTVNQPGDAFEQEADRVADKVMRMADPVLTQPLTQTPLVRSSAGLQRCSCGSGKTGEECEGCKAQAMRLQRASAAEAADTAPPIIHDVLNSPGSSLDAGTRRFMEPRFGYDFGGVRIHTGAVAAKSAQAVDALAYTVGNHIAFDAGRYAPSSTAGQRILAHELTHVIQQTGGNSSAAQSSGPVINTSPLLQRQDPPQQVPQTQPAPIDTQRDFHVRPTLDPQTIDLGLEFIRGRHAISADIGVDTPLGLLSERFFGTAEPLARLQYRNRCNQAIESAVIELREAQQHGHFLDFSQNFWEIGASLGLRINDVAITPGGTVSFNGSRFDNVAFTITLAAASTQVPPECREIISRPPPTRDTAPPSQRDDDHHGERDRDGNPPPNPVPSPTRTPQAAPETIYFFYDTTVVRPQSNSALDRILMLMQAIPSLNVQLTGHTSLEGTEQYNLRLSRRRAESIRDYLVSHGIAATRMSSMGLGEYAPAVPEPDVGRFALSPGLEALRDQNRRVEVTFWDSTGRFAPDSPQFRLTIPHSTRFRLTE